MSEREREGEGGRERESRFCTPHERFCPAHRCSLGAWDPPKCPQAPCAMSMYVRAEIACNTVSGYAGKNALGGRENGLS